MVPRCYQVLTLLVFAKTVSQQGIRTDNYISLIKNVYNYYGSSYVFFIQSGNFEDIRVTNLMHTWTWEFSQERLFSVAMTFPSLLINSKRFIRPTVRPLYVILLNREETLDEFIDITGQIKSWISEPVWLVIFMEYNGSKPLAQTCENPRTNFFNLKFNTEMLVLCYDLSILREWYSVDGDKTRTYDLAIWRTHSGEESELELLTNTSLYARRGNLFNITLRIATINESAFIWLEDDKVVNGLLGMILNELSASLNFRMEILEPQMTYGSWNHETQSWNGVIGQLVNDQADIGVAEFTMTNKRLSAVDFTLPLILSRNRLYFKASSSATVQWSAHFQAFDYKIWTAIILLIVTTPLVLSWLKARSYQPVTKTSLSLYAIISESYTRIFGIYCQQGLSEFPTQDSLRMAYFSIFVSSLIVYSAYSAALISFLTVIVPSLPFTSFEEFIADRSYKLIVFQNSADYDMFRESADPVLTSMNKLMKDKEELPLNIEDGFKQVCKEKVAFYTTEALKETINFNLACKIVYIESGRTDSLAMALPKGSPYTGLINYHLQRFQDNGVLARFRELHSPKSAEKEPAHPSVSLWGIAPILAILVGGIISGLIILAAERAFIVYHEKAGKAEEKIPNTKPTYLMSYWP